MNNAHGIASVASRTPFDPTLEQCHVAGLDQRLVKQLNEAQRIARIGSWHLDWETGSLEWSDEIYRIFEIDQSRFVASYEGFLNAIHPDDRGLVDAAFKASVDNKRPYEITHRLLNANGRVKFVRERGETEYSDEGKPIRSNGTVQDITDLRLAEEARDLFFNAFEHSGEAMLLTDANRKVITVNQAFTRTTGYSLDEVKGQDPKMLASGQVSAQVYQQMWHALNSTGFWQGELWDRRKNGEVFPKWTTISALKNASGQVTHYAASYIDISELKSVEERVHFLTHFDPLTGLYNRNSLENRLDQAILSARRDGERAAILSIDLDRFAKINDSLGFRVGDGLLRKAGRRLTGCVRESDVVARLSEDQYVVVLCGVESVASIASVIEKLRTRLAEPYLIGGHTVHTTATIGISIFPDDGGDSLQLLKNSNAAMFHGKSRGRNTVEFFTREMTADAEERLALEHELRGAIASKQFQLHYQPQFASATGKLIGYEALVRWKHPVRGLVPPDRFVSIAEECGLINELGSWVLHEACRQLAEWRSRGHALDIRMAVNLSASQLKLPSLVDDVQQALERHGIGGDDLEIEITESVAMQDPQWCIEQLRQLRGLGISLAIDDFGTGYSSLAYLKQLPIHVLKLDRSFVRDIEENQTGAMISAATISLAHNLGLKVVAEGVETEAQQEYLAARQCDYLQGYRFSKPLPPDLLYFGGEESIAGARPFQAVHPVERQEIAA